MAFISSFTKSERPKASHFNRREVIAVDPVQVFYAGKFGARVGSEINLSFSLGHNKESISTVLGPFFIFLNLNLYQHEFDDTKLKKGESASFPKFINTESGFPTRDHNTRARCYKGRQVCNVVHDEPC